MKCEEWIVETKGNQLRLFGVTFKCKFEGYLKGTLKEILREFARGIVEL